MQNIGLFADDIFKCIVLKENVWIWVEIALQFVPRGAIDKTTSFQIVACHWIGTKPLSRV